MGASGGSAPPLCRAAVAVGTPHFEMKNEKRYLSRIARESTHGGVSCRRPFRALEAGVISVLTGRSRDVTYVVLTGQKLKSHRIGDICYVPTHLRGRECEHAIVITKSCRPRVVLLKARR